MLIEVSAKEFSQFFPSDPNPFISEKFVELNKGKVDRIVRLIEDKEGVSIGLLAGINKGFLKAPFSAPFGGFHYRKESIYTKEIESFLEHLKDYARIQGISKIFLTLMPTIYQQCFNAKVVNTLIRKGFDMTLPDITNWVELERFNCKFSHRNSREYFQQAVKNQLVFNVLSDQKEKNIAYDLICENRSRFGRPIYMTFNDIMQTTKIWPIDFFSVTNLEGHMLASGVFYQFSKNVTYAVFWGDNDAGRPLRAMDFLVYNLFCHYKSLGFEYIDLGISTEWGIPNEGLLRFKETHECISSLRFSFTWDSLS